MQTTGCCDLQLHTTRLIRYREGYKGFLATCTKHMHLHTHSPQAAPSFHAAAPLPSQQTPGEQRWGKHNLRCAHKERDRWCTGSWAKSQANNTHIHMYVEQPNPLSLDKAPRQLDTILWIFLVVGRSWIASWIAGTRSWIASWLEVLNS